MHIYLIELLEMIGDEAWEDAAHDAEIMAESLLIGGKALHSPILSGYFEKIASFFLKVCVTTSQKASLFLFGY